MSIIKIPYYKKHIEFDISNENVVAVLEPDTELNNKNLKEGDIVRESLENPIKSQKLRDLAVGKKNILIITSDHTRPMPSNITMPILLEEIRGNNNKANIKLLVGTGFHRLTTKEELMDRFGNKIVQGEEIIVHDSKDKSNMVCRGKLPSGGNLYLNSLVDWADLVIAEGFIEPHFFAGFSGGRKSILPGIASAETVLYNHNSKFIANSCSRTGILDNNPLHNDMIFAAKVAKLKFILNVTLDKEKKITTAFSGDPYAAHKEGVKYVSKLAAVEKKMGDIVITSNGGYPLDQNIYQAVKGMTAAESCVKKNGVIIMVASCCDGHGGEGFYQWFNKAQSAKEVYMKIERIKPENTLPDQWEAQILARVLKKNKVILVTDMCDKKIINNMHMLHADNLNKALSMAKNLTKSNADIVIIPDGVSII